MNYFGKNFEVFGNLFSIVLFYVSHENFFRIFDKIIFSIFSPGFSHFKVLPRIDLFLKISFFWLEPWFILTHEIFLFGKIYCFLLLVGISISVYHFKKDCFLRLIFFYMVKFRFVLMDRLFSQKNLVFLLWKIRCFGLVHKRTSFFYNLVKFSFSVGRWRVLCFSRKVKVEMKGTLKPAEGAEGTLKPAERVKGTLKPAEMVKERCLFQ